MESKPLPFILSVSRDHRKWLFFGAIAVICASALSTGLGYFFKLIVDAITTNDTRTALILALSYPFILFAIQLIYRVSGYCVAHFTVKISKTATDRLSQYLLYQPQNYFSDRFAGAVANKIKNVTNALDQIVPDLIWSQLDTLVTFIVALALLLMVDISVAMAFLGLLIVLALINKRIAPGKARIARENAEAGTELQGRVVDVISNSSTVRQYVQHDYELLGIKNLTQKKQSTGLANWLYTEKVLLANACAIFVFVSIMFYFLISLWQEKAITSGDFILVATLVSQMSGTMLFIGRAVNSTARSFGELREGLDDLLVPYEIVDNKDSYQLSVKEGSISLAGVSFSYQENEVFSNLSFNIPAKQKVGIVGTSGAGKSTLVSLLLRQHDIQSGSISIDGQDIRNVTQDSLRKSIALVPQEPAMFHRSIFANISYSKPNATLEEVKNAAKLAHAVDFIEKLADGYETMVGERGVKLSGGQKQRIAIARAILKDSPILILDEATSALDSESEKYIQAALHDLMQGRTVIAIAHRLSTLKELDRIIVIDGGLVVEDGNHESLVASGGVYAKLWAHQVGGFITE